MYHDEEHDGYSSSEYVDIVSSLKETAAKYGFDYELFHEQYLRVQDLSRNLHFIEETKRKQAKMYKKHMKLQALKMRELKQAILEEQQLNRNPPNLLNRYQQDPFSDDYQSGAWGIQSQYPMPGCSRFGQCSSRPLGYPSTAAASQNIHDMPQQLLLQQGQQEQLIRQQIQQHQLLYQQQQHCHQQIDYSFMNPEYSSFMDQQIASQQFLLNEATRIANQGHDNLQRQMQTQPQRQPLQQRYLQEQPQVPQAKQANNKKELAKSPLNPNGQQPHCSRSQNGENLLHQYHLKKPSVEQISSQLSCQQLAPNNNNKLLLQSKQTSSKQAKQPAPRKDHPLLRQLLQPESVLSRQQLSSPQPMVPQQQTVPQQGEKQPEQEHLLPKQQELSQQPEERTQLQLPLEQQANSQQLLVPNQQVLSQLQTQNQEQLVSQLEKIKKQQQLLQQQLLARRQELPQEQPIIVKHKKKKGKSKREKQRIAEEEAQQRLQLLNVPPPQLLDEERLFPIDILERGAPSDKSSDESGISSIIGRPSDNRKLENVIVPKAFLTNAVPTKDEVISEETLEEFEKWRVNIEALLETFKNKEMNEVYGPERNARLKKVLRSTLVTLLIEKKLGRRMTVEELVQFEEDTSNNLFGHVKGFYTHIKEQINEMKAVIEEKGLKTIAHENYLNYNITNKKYPFDEEK